MCICYQTGHREQQKLGNTLYSTGFRIGSSVLIKNKKARFRSGPPVRIENEKTRFRSRPFRFQSGLFRFQSGLFRFQSGIFVSNPGLLFPIRALPIKTRSERPVRSNPCWICILLFASPFFCSQTDTEKQMIAGLGSPRRPCPCCTALYL